MADETGSTGGEAIEGVVIRSLSSRVIVAVGEVQYSCRVRGRLRRGDRETLTVVVAGDRVRLTPVADSGSDEHAGMIEEVLPRRNRISRLTSRRSGKPFEQVLMANLDQVVAVQSIAQPAPVAGFIDRLLVAAERFGVAGVLCLNKCDLDEKAAIEGRWEYYRRIGYDLVRTSVVTPLGLEELTGLLGGKLSILLGASGVGKSSLLNATHPELGLRIGAVTEKTGLGRHTTTRTELFPLAGGGFIADSPGIRGFDPWDVAPDELREYFPDFTEPGGACRFRSCVHRDEPSCGVKAAVRSGAIPVWRHEAYLALLTSLEDRSERERRRTRK